MVNLGQILTTIEMFQITNIQGIIIYSIFLVFALFWMIWFSITAANSTEKATQNNIQSVNGMSQFGILSELNNKLVITFGIIFLIILFISIISATNSNYNSTTLSIAHQWNTVGALFNTLILVIVIALIIFNILLVATPMGRSLQKVQQVGDIFLK
jgi:ABC-type Fe3+ transport system permease subunit